MASTLSAKQLNPRAQSWFPDAKKPSQKLPFPLPREICGILSTHVASAAVCEPFPQPPPLHLHPPVVVFQAPHEGSLHYAVFQHECLPFGYISSYPIYASYPDPLMEKKDGEVKDVTTETLAEDSNSLKGIWGIPRSRPKFSRKVVPPRLRRRHCVEFQGRKRLPRNVWKPKITEDGVAATEIVPLASLPGEECPVSERTTVMLKNIPNQYRRDSLMEFLDKNCLELHLAYDFLYLPMDFIKGDNLGFAFVNFTTASAATKIKSALEGYEWGEFYIPNGKFTSRKILQITWAKIQGKDALVRHFQNSRFICDNIQYLPVVISPPSNGSSISSLITIGQLQGFKKSSKTAKKPTEPAV